MSLHKLNNVEVEIDMEDADFLERYEKAFLNMEEEEKELQKVGSGSAILKGYCQMFYRLFDDIFGAGTGDKIFKGKYNSRLTDEVYSDFIAICSQQAKESASRRNKLVAKYQPKRK